MLAAPHSVLTLREGSALPRLTALAVAVLAPFAVCAQDAQIGKRLFEDTIAVTGLNNLTGNCTSCHATVQNRRIKIAGSATAEISPDVASDRLRVAIVSIGSMAQFSALSPEQVQHLAAYLADTPRRSAAQLDFVAQAVNTVTAVQTVDLRHAVATTTPLQVLGVAIGGNDAARFRRTADSCDQQTLQPGASCRVAVSYTAPDTAGVTAPMTFTLREGNAGASFTRVVTLQGTVAVTAPPANPAPAADGGGGAVSWLWVLGVGLAAGVLRLARQNNHGGRRTG